MSVPRSRPFIRTRALSRTSPRSSCHAVAGPLLAERNLLEIDVTNQMANRIADLDRRHVPWKKFYNVNFPARMPENRGPDGLFTAAGWDPLESGLLGPVTLQPVRIGVATE